MIGEIQNSGVTRAGPGRHTGEVGKNFQKSVNGFLSQFQKARVRIFGSDGVKTFFLNGDI